MRQKNARDRNAGDRMSGFDEFDGAFFPLCPIASVLQRSSAVVKIYCVVYLNVSQLVNMRTHCIVVWIRMNRPEWSFVRLCTTKSKPLLPSFRVTFSGFPPSPCLSLSICLWLSVLLLRVYANPQLTRHSFGCAHKLDRASHDTEQHRLHGSQTQTLIPFCVCCMDDEERNGGNRCVWLDCVRDIFEWRGWMLRRRRYSHR